LFFGIPLELVGAPLRFCDAKPNRG
jgi:hypothetical protein